MSLTDHLRADHQRIRDLLDHLARRQGSARSEILVQLGRELAIHASIEEDLLYPLLEPGSLGRDVRHAYAEHHLINVQFDEIIVLSADERVTADKIHVLDEVITHHLDEEETDVFPRIATSLGKARARKLADTYPSLREDLERDFSDNPPASIQGWFQRRSFAQRH